MINTVKLQKSKERNYKYIFYALLLVFSLYILGNVVVAEVIGNFPSAKAIWSGGLVSNYVVGSGETNSEKLITSGTDNPAEESKVTARTWLWALIPLELVAMGVLILLMRINTAGSMKGLFMILGLAIVFILMFLIITNMLTAF